MHVARYDGPVAHGDRVMQKTKLRFTWHLIAEGVREACEVQLLCHHAARRGVHLPEKWKSNLNLCNEVPAVDAFAHSAVQRVWQELALPDATKLDCRLHHSTDEHTHIQTLLHAGFCFFVLGTQAPAVLL